MYLAMSRERRLTPPTSDRQEILERRLHPGDVVFCASLRCERNRRWLKGLAGLEQLSRLGEIHVGYARVAVPLKQDQSFPAESPDGFAEWGDADAHGLSQLVLSQFRAGPERPVEDLLAELGIRHVRLAGEHVRRHSTIIAHTYKKHLVCDLRHG